MNSSFDPSEIFIRNWEIYQKIILANYMKHHELGNYVQNHIHNFAKHKALKILDIGCGDAQQIANQLQSFNIFSYTGYDLSEQAIQFAKKNTEKLNCQVEFELGSMETLIKADSNKYNILYSSFAIHHLTDEIKSDFIRDCYNKLEEEGLFILIDIKRQPGQSREDYKKSYADWIKSTWHALTQQEQNAIIDHLYTCDIPVESSTYVDYALSSGLSFIEEVDIDSRHTLLVFSKN